MGEHTSIEWTDATWNPITGCSIKSSGCINCYAMGLAATRLRNHPSREGLTQDSKAGPVWNGQVRLNEQWLDQPLRWKRPRTIFVCAHGDLFHESVPDEWIDRVFAVMALCPQHRFQVLTKRSARMRAYFEGPETLSRIEEATEEFHDLGCIRPWPLPNVWLGVSVEDQRAADERIPDLLETPAAVRFLSCEPLLGPVDLLAFIDPTGACCGGEPEYRCSNCPSDASWRYSIPSDDGQWAFDPTLDWIIVGGESGKGARPMHPDWARSLRDQCETAGVPFFFKQWGEWEVALDRERDDPDWRADYANNYVDRGKSKWLNLAGGCGFHGERFHVMRRVGKKKSGRLLDGVQHDGTPV